VGENTKGNLKNEPQGRYEKDELLCKDKRGGGEGGGGGIIQESGSSKRKQVTSYTLVSVL